MIIKVHQLLRMCQHQENNIKCSNLAYSFHYRRVGETYKTLFSCQKHRAFGVSNFRKIDTNDAPKKSYGLGYDINGNLVNYDQK